MRTIGVVTVGRSDYGIYLPILHKIQADSELKLHLIVAGMHLSPEFGLTVKAIEEDGFEIAERVEMLLSSDTPEGIAKSMGLGIIGFAQAYARFRPDILVVLGDRFEMHVATLAALPFRKSLGWPCVSPAGAGRCFPCSLPLAMVRHRRKDGDL